jgi:hypothetical protein
MGPINLSNAILRAREGYPARAANGYGLFGNEREHREARISPGPPWEIRPQ